jgi:CRISPR/Cas system-associated exonuclease Cas4 (RecB family)
MNKVESVSASQLATFDECPRKWWAIYTHKIPRPEQDPSARLGSAMHKAAEVSLMASVKDVSKYANPEVLLDAAVAKYSLNQAQKMQLKAMLHTLKEMEWTKTYGMTTAECEIAYEIARTRVVIKVDRIDEDPEWFRIIDLKSSSTPYTIEETNNSWQTLLYSYPMLDRQKPVCVEYWFVRFPMCKVKSHVILESKKKTIDRFIDTVEKMKKYEGDTYRKSFCHRCPAAELCKTFQNNPFKLKTE